MFTTQTSYFQVEMCTRVVEVLKTHLIYIQDIEVNKIFCHITHYKD